MKFVVTGCSRSGTKYVAHLLLGAGIQCGHEDVFNSWGADYNTAPDWAGSDFDGDSSYNAAPFLEDLAPELTIVHLIRPPIDHIRSTVGIGELDRSRPWVQFIDRHVRILSVEPGPERAAEYWLRWNALIEPHADVTWLLPEIGAGHIEDLCQRAGLAFDVAATERALAVTSRQTNHRNRAGTISMYDLGGSAQAVAAAADRYGLPLESVAD